MADAVMIGGANGAGKTTFARQMVPTLYPGSVFLNADEIQTEGAAFVHPVAAGRELLRRFVIGRLRGSACGRSRRGGWPFGARG